MASELGLVKDKVVRENSNYVLNNRT